MPLLQPPSPLAPPRRPRGAWRPAGMALLGAVAVALLGGGGPLGPIPALLAAMALLLAGLALSRPAMMRVQPLEPVMRAQAAAADPRDAATPAEAMLEGLTDPVLLVTAREPDDYTDRRVTFANGAARDLLRLSAGGILTSALRDPEVLEAVDEALFGQTHASAGYQPDGAQGRYWRARVRPLATAPGGMRRAMLTLRDETDERRNERMRADFLANASHELRTPLASLSGFIDTLQGHAKDDPAARARFLEIMGAQTARMTRLVDDLMSLSRIELNEHIAPRGHVELPLAAADVVDALGPLAHQKNVQLVLETPARAVGRPERICADRDQVLQVVQNLLANALGYSPEGAEVRVSVQSGLSLLDCTATRVPGRSRLSLVTPTAQPGQRYAVVRVMDAGPGMAREHLPRLTERFYRVEGQKSGARAGTGLGLAIVEHIMVRHKGGLAVETAPKQGADFIAYFPLAEG